MQQTVTLQSILKSLEAEKCPVCGSDDLFCVPWDKTSLVHGGLEGVFTKLHLTWDWRIYRCNQCDHCTIEWDSYSGFGRRLRTMIVFALPHDIAFEEGRDSAG